MNHNKNNVRVGQNVKLDVDYKNGSIVNIQSMTIQQMFSTVCSVDADGNPIGESWQVMTCRLTPIVQEIVHDSENDCDEDIYLGFYCPLPDYMY